ncbi:MAG: acyl-CoA thioesterase [Hydrocarboniphaga sp.]|uniref:acyl-CoA thioesterase n=1 Tax=Hydrocarboniphaga sp. TaxID=2033016 RepID=UPI0026093DCE|nr:acyl-CoA thioesterase domain-containing protein [Hydrocarboniphaga sp.]MDB5969919.1 acyl-CoA thioesterase [Hydrocarboniphaga sp.]
MPDDTQKPAARRTWASLPELMRVTACGDGEFSALHSVPNIGGKVFGGQMIAQGLAAAAADVADERRLHMLQAGFLTPVDLDPPPRYQVTPTLEGRSYSRRDVVVRQQGRLAFQMSCGFKRREPGPRRAQTMPAVPPPEALPGLAELADLHRSELSDGMRRVLTGIPHYQIRPIDGRAFLFGPGEPRLRYWIRPSNGTDAAPRAQELLLGFLSDAFFNSAMLMPHIRQRLGRDFAAPTLNHSLWLHGGTAVDEWLLFDTESAVVEDGCGLVNAAIYDRGGMRIASATQESMLRLLG